MIVVILVSDTRGARDDCGYTGLYDMREERYDCGYTGFYDMREGEGR